MPDDTDPWLLDALSGEMVTESIFRQQLQWLQAHHRMVTLDELLRDATPGCIAITFDDGFADNLLRAAPILSEMQIPATVFVITSRLGDAQGMQHHRAARWLATDRAWQRDPSLRPKQVLAKLLAELQSDHDLRARVLTATHPEDRFLGYEELAQLTAHNIDVQSHTISHRPLSALSNDELDNELITSQATLTRLTGRKIDKIAYPLGRREHIDTRTAKAAARVYCYGFAAQPGFIEPTKRQDVHLLPRIGTRNSLADLRKRLRRRYPEVRTSA
ncbi:MAG: polysaccharide deacetylase family protein [Pseudomonadota bacterium]